MNRSSIAFVLSIMALMVFGSGITMVIQENRAAETLVAWNIYRGEIPGYVVEIRETRYANGDAGRIVHVDRIEDLENGCSWCGITGHDYEGEFVNDGTDWDRVFRCGFPDYSNGCNSVFFYDSDMDPKWEPSPADEDEALLEPTFREALPNAMDKLHIAMSHIYNEEHLVSTLEQWRKKHNES